MDLNLKPITVSGDDLTALSERSGRMLQKIRDSMLQPFPRKQAPTFSSGKVQDLCGIDKTRMNYLLTKDFPQGEQAAKGRQRTFSLEDTIKWVKGTIGKDKQRPEGQLGKVIAVANFKGGVTKTTTSMILAQGLSVRHARKVLIIDLDPQGSTTTFFGINPHAEIEADQTILPLIDSSKTKWQTLKNYSSKYSLNASQLGKIIFFLHLERQGFKTKISKTSIFAHLS